MKIVDKSHLEIGVEYHYRATGVMGVTEGDAVFAGFRDGLPLFSKTDFPIPVIMNPTYGWVFYTKTD
jgi:hypothetical protein